MPSMKKYLVFVLGPISWSLMSQYWLFVCNHILLICIAFPVQQNTPCLQKTGHAYYVS